ncbi:DUF1761 domain-containing protein [Pseudohongiella sp.]|uniref:DUF1761 domain-containing protein n=1 Tax=marine sediment metagenome TaxID=412755 RepID=A0A0F9VY96_9ZZZZ|nr:DUF1761 domain-containing protein [Pseudohongiella sp.]HDZ07956.1 DUF1761 domain-containing protein [Pseudohongiella sp.]HEA64437.1 DUF1761 domain-containing protein [Pseudohongiella sp.]
MEFNYLAIILAGISAFVLGGLWYSPVGFGKVWQRETGVSTDNINRVKVFGGAFVLSLIAAFVFAMFLGPDPSLQLGLGAGFAAGAGWVATSFGINYLFAQRSLTLFLIDGGYHTLQFTLYGLILFLF